MKKGLISLLLIPTLLFAGCADNPLEHSYDIEAAYSRPEQEPTADLPPVDNTTPFDPDKDPIDIHAVAQTFLLRQYNPYTLADIAAGIGIPCLRETEAGALYSIHPVQQGGRLLIFYENSDRAGIMEWYYVAKPLSHQDFERIKNGSTMDDVKKIDPSAQIFENIYYANPNDWPAYMISRHYLTDGILEFGYTIEEGKFIIQDSQLIDDFEIRRPYAEYSPIYDGHLLPIDALDTWES